MNWPNSSDKNEITCNFMKVTVQILLFSIAFKVGDGSLSHNLAVNLEDEIQQILAELRESDDSYIDEDFNIADREAMDEIFREIADPFSIRKVYKNEELEGRASKKDSFIKFS